MTRQDAKNAKEKLLEPNAVLDDTARRVIGAAIEVHRHLGPGFAEALYEESLAIEFSLRGIAFLRQPEVEVGYKGQRVGLGRPDFVVCESLVVEIKAVSTLAPVHQAQVISYLKAMDSQLGLLLNFREGSMRKGIRRVVWSGGHSYSQQETNNVNEAHEAGDRLVVSRSDSAIPLEVVKEDLNAIA